MTKLQVIEEMPDLRPLLDLNLFDLWFHTKKYQENQKIMATNAVILEVIQDLSSQRFAEVFARHEEVMCLEKTIVQMFRDAATSV